MKIPDKVKILGITYDVEQVDYIDREVFRLGQINFVTSEIKLISDLSEPKKEEVLLHEIFHGIFEALHIEIEDDEEKVQRLAAAFHQIIKDNPLLFT